MKLVDLTGQRFGHWVVEGRDAAQSAAHGVYWRCRCDCGTQASIEGRKLRVGETQSCGCRRYEALGGDLGGQRFGRLLVLHEDPVRSLSGKYPIVHWHCRCDCGNRTLVRSSHLRGGRIKSCGCLRNETSRARMTKHGGARTPEYQAWMNMVRRCHDPKNSGYQWYGARGIAVCDAWRSSFATFLKDMGPRPSPEHSMDRKDNSRGYEPGNVVWADGVTQANNKRTNRLITFAGRTQTLAQWSRETGVSISAIHKRLTYFGWSVEEALTTPVGDH